MSPDVGLRWLLVWLFRGEAVRLALLGKAEFSTSRKIGMAALRLYLAVAMILVTIKIVQVCPGALTRQPERPGRTENQPGR